MMQSKNDEYSYFLLREKEVDSVAEAYFCTRAVDEEEDQSYDSSSCFDDSSDNETEQESQNGGEFEFEFGLSDVDRSERLIVEFFLRKGCGCAHGDKESPCSSTIPLEDVVDCRNNCAELTSTELDLVILGTIHSSINCDKVSHSGRTEKIRQRTRIPFFFHSKRICLKTFLFMHRLHKTRFYSLVKHYWKNGLSLRIHGNKRRLPSSAFSAETIECVVKFIMNIAKTRLSFFQVAFLVLKELM